MKKTLKSTHRIINLEAFKKLIIKDLIEAIKKIVAPNTKLILV